MESLALLPTDLAVFIDPLARPAAARQGELDVPNATLAPGDAFAHFLSLLAPPLASGQELPSSGNSLPVALPQPAPTELEPAVENTMQIPSGDLAMGGSTPWLPVRVDPAATTIAMPPEAPVETLLRGTVDASVVRASLFGPAAVPMVPVHAAPPLRGPDASTAVALDSLAPASPDALPAGATPVAAEAPSGEALEAETFDALVRGDALSDAPRTRAEGRASPQAPVVASADSLGAAAVRLAPPDPAAAQATVRAAESAVGAPRAPRKGDAVALAGSIAAFTEPSAAPPAEGLPPAMPTVAASQNAPAVSVPPGMTQAPVDTRGPQWQEALAGRVQWLVDQRVGEARIKLNPPELGAVDVKISLVEDKTFVQLTAATTAARDELAQSLPRLRELFAASGLELGGASVESGRGGHPGTGGGYEAVPRNTGERPDLELLPATAPTRVARPSAGAIDVFA
jgi:flagellar hook-length control protein FliK